MSLASLIEWGKTQAKIVRSRESFCFTIATLPWRIGR
jgi:hypothetical protein